MEFLIVFREYFASGIFYIWHLELTLQITYSILIPTNEAKTVPSTLKNLRTIRLLTLLRQSLRVWEPKNKWRANMVLTASGTDRAETLLYVIHKPEP